MHRSTSESNGPYVPRDQNLRLVTSVSTKGTGIQPSKQLKNELPATYTTVPQLCDGAGGKPVRGALNCGVVSGLVCEVKLHSSLALLERPGAWGGGKNGTPS